MLKRTVQQEYLMEQDYIKFKTKVTVQRNEVSDDDTSNHVDITSAVENIFYNYDLERRNATLSLTIDNIHGLYSPKNKNSDINKWNGQYNPLIYPNHKIRVWFYLDDEFLDDPFVPDSNNPAWHVFTGITGDDIDLDTDSFTIELAVRDKSKILQDTYIELSRSYDNMVTEDVIIDILNQFVPGQFTFTRNINETREGYFIVPEPTNYLISHYQVKDSNVWDAIQKLADLMGWVLRFNGKGQLLLYEEPEDISVEYYTITPDDIIRDVQGMSDADIRNDIIVKSQTQNYDFIQARYRNEQSIIDFGYRPFIVSQDLTSYINTYSQAYKLARAICRDLSWLRSRDTCELPLSPFIEVGDIIKIVNPRSSTNNDGDNQELYKVYSVDIKYNANQKRTSIDVREYKQLPPYGEVVKPMAPTGLNCSDYEEKEQYVYDIDTGSWSKIKHKFKYPKLRWNEVTLNEPIPPNSSTLITDLTCYNIYRKKAEDDKYIIVSSVMAYYQNLKNEPITYFIDYTLNPSLQEDLIYNYKITAENEKGMESDFSTEIEVVVPKVEVIEL